MGIYTPDRKEASGISLVMSCWISIKGIRNVHKSCRESTELVSSLDKRMYVLQLKSLYGLMFSDAWQTNSGSCHKAFNIRFGLITKSICPATFLHTFTSQKCKRQKLLYSCKR